jgi:hypothetical protein
MPSFPTDRTHLRPAELAAAWGVAVKTIYRRIDAGDIIVDQPAGKRGAISIPIASLPPRKAGKTHEVQAAKSHSGRRPRWLEK